MRSSITHEDENRYNEGIIINLTLVIIQRHWLISPRPLEEISCELCNVVSVRLIEDDGAFSAARIVDRADAQMTAQRSSAVILCID